MEPIPTTCILQCNQKYSRDCGLFLKVNCGRSENNLLNACWFLLEFVLLNKINRLFEALLLHMHWNLLDWYHSSFYYNLEELLPITKNMLRMAWLHQVDGVAVNILWEGMKCWIMVTEEYKKHSQFCSNQGYPQPNHALFEFSETHRGL